MILFLKHIDIEGPGTLGEFFEKQGFETKTFELDKNNELPEDFSGSEAVVVLGGPMNVYEEEKYSFLKKENVFIKRALENEIPILGVCLGAQLLAKALNASVRKSPSKEIGFFDISLTKEGIDDPIFKNIDTFLKVFQWHEDMFDIPRGARFLAKSEGCPNQAFCFGKRTYGFQFHIEIDRRMIESWMKEYLKIDDASKDKKAREVMKEYDKIKAMLNFQSDIIYKNFADIIKR